jgi:hypothetical protein
MWKGWGVVVEDDGRLGNCHIIAVAAGWQKSGWDAVLLWIL